MFETLVGIFKVEKTRKRVFFTLAMLIIYRFASYIVVPGVSPTAVSLFSKFSTQTGGLLDLFSGGSLQRASILALGVGPYVTASIVVQLLQMDVVPTLSRWRKEGEEGRQKANNLTRILAVIFSLINGISMSIYLNNTSNGLTLFEGTWYNYAFVGLMFTTGTMFLLWLGDQITDHGVGNGVSFLIMAGIISGLPSSLLQMYYNLCTDTTTKTRLEGLELLQGVLIMLLVFILFLFVVIIIIYMTQATRKLPIQYSRSNTSYGAHRNHLPLKINTAGVVPVIFAVSVMQAPVIIANLAGKNWEWLSTYTNYSGLKNGVPANPNVIALLIYVAFIVFFSYFYTFLQVNPEETAENLQKQGGYLPGIRPGKSTEEYISKVLMRLTTVGGLFLVFVSLVPILGTGYYAPLRGVLQLGGTSLLIMIGVIIETAKQLETAITSRHYSKGFITRRK